MVIVGVAALTALFLMPLLPSQHSTSPIGARAATPSPSIPSSPAVASPRPTTIDIPSPLPSPTPTAKVRIDEAGVPRSDVTSDGTWTVAGKIDVPASSRGGTHRYLLRVEGGTGIDADAVAPTINAILNDDRGWAAVDNVEFVQVQEGEKADFTLNLATPATVDKLCEPLETESRWSCRNGATVNLNSDRWNYLVPWFPDEQTYRAYLVNHEVGHWLGRDHEDCPGAGRRAPLMMQQSGGVGQCLPNAWPVYDGQEAA